MDYQEWQEGLFPSLGKPNKKKELMNNLRDINWAISVLNKYEHRGLKNWNKHCCSDMCYAREILALPDVELGYPTRYQDLMLTAYEAIAVAEKYEREARAKVVAAEVREKMLQAKLPGLPSMPKGFA